MIQTMTNEQILTAAHSDIVRNINRGTFKGLDYPMDNEENFYSITSLYSQWANDPIEMEELLWRMYEENFGELLKGY